MDTHFTRSADYVRNRVFKRVCAKLLEEGWEQSTICPDRFHHPKFGTHEAFKAVKLQREEDIKIGRRIAILTICGLLFVYVYLFSMLAR